MEGGDGFLTDSQVRKERYLKNKEQVILRNLKTYYEARHTIRLPLIINDTCHIEAIFVNKEAIIQCPRCYSRYSASGKPHGLSTLLFHKIPLSTSDNQTITVRDICLPGRSPIKTFVISVTDNTMRIRDSKSVT